ncbi:YciI family protein [Duganella hordei]|uniref:YciI family protein n=1 Tax=Duganella hordei TaxID=2865934 RepID=UPI0030E83F9F
MYIVDLTYLKPLAEIEPHLAAHRAFLDEHYVRGIFIASGPKNPRDGGVIVVGGRVSRPELDALLAQDPFAKNGIASYRVTEFEATKHLPALAELL